jgi:hypothetical protein
MDKVQLLGFVAILSLLASKGVQHAAATNAGVDAWATADSINQHRLTRDGVDAHEAQVAGATILVNTP